MLNQIWELETDRVEECIVAKLPPPAYVLPRSRKCPGEKQLTKWEKFAKEKGIKKTKKDKKTFDTELGKWVPTYGFKRAQADKDKTWVLEVPKNADPMEDQFQKKLDMRSEKVAKNEVQRMKNIVRAKKVEVPRTGYLGPEAASSTELLTAATIAKSSTASVGKFQEKLSKEKVARGIGVKEVSRVTVVICQPDDKFFFSSSFSSFQDQNGRLLMLPKFQKIFKISSSLRAF